MDTGGDGKEHRARKRVATAAAVTKPVGLEEKYRNILEEMDWGYYEVDARGNLTFINDAAARLNGYTREEMLGMNFRQYVPQEYWKSTLENFSRVFLTGVPLRGYPMVRLKKDGSLIYHEDSVFPIKDEKGRTVGLRGIGRDVTRQKRAEEALLEEKRFSEALIDSLPGIFYLIDEEGCFVRYNRNAREVVGYSSEEGRNLHAMDVIAEEDRQHIASWLSDVYRNGSGDTEVQLLTKDGRKVPYHISAKRITLGGRTYLLGTGVDISRRLEAERARAEIEKNYRLLAENTSDVVCIMDLKAYPTWISSSLTRASGFTLDDLQTMPPEKQMTAESLKKVRELLAKAFKDEADGLGGIDRHYDAELEVYRKDGSTQWTENRFTFIRDINGRPTGILMQGKIITDRKLAEQARDRSEKAYRLLAEHSSDMIVVIDINDFSTTCLSIPNELAKGFTREEVEKMPIDELVTPDSLNKLMEILPKAFAEAIENRGETDIHYDMEMEVYCRDGSTIWTENRFTIMRGEDGMPTGLLMQGRDITDRKRAEKARDESERNYRLLAENTSDVVSIVDMNNRLVWQSVSAEKLTGWTFEEARQMPLKKKVTRESLVRTLEVFNRAMEEERQGADPNRRYSIESELYCKDGSTVWTETTISIIRDDKGQATALLLQGRDITERKKAEEALKKTLDDLRRSNEELQQFAYVASHDLQEPLRMVSSYVQLIEKRYKDRLDADALDFIGYAVSGAKRMQNLINDLLSYSRVGTRGKPFRLFDCNEALYAALSNLEIAIQENNAVITHGEMPELVGDEGQIIQVFQNLVGNAIKFHAAVPPEVHIEAVPRDGEWLFSVKDNGIGIDPQYFERIFLVFQRLNGSEYPGTGIGLSVARKIVQRHGGSIWLASVPGQGSTFYFTIPIMKEEKTTNDTGGSS